MPCGNAQNPCTDLEVNNIVPFSCLASVPADFDISTINLQAVRFIFNIDNVECCTEQCLGTCNVNGTVPVQVGLCVVRLVGSISFYFNAYPVLTADKFGITTNPAIPIIPENIANICCGDIVTLNNIVGVYSADNPMFENFDACATLNLDSEDPNEGIVGVLTNIQEQIIPNITNKRFVLFTGQFTLPLVVLPV